VKAKAKWKMAVEVTRCWNSNKYVDKLVSQDERGNGPSAHIESTQLFMRPLYMKEFMINRK